jgi:hypothetical protein
MLEARANRTLTGALLACGFVGAPDAAADVVTWTGAGDGTSWNDTDNWDSPRLPGAGDDVVIDMMGANVELGSVAEIATLQCMGALTINANGLLDISGPSSARALNVAGDLSGAGDLAIDETMTWTGGTLTGPGELQIGAMATASLTVIPPARLARDVANNGTLLLGGSVSFDSEPGETTEIVNLPSGTIEVTVADVAVVTGASGRITNLATMQIVELEVAHPLEFNNVGSIEVSDFLALHTSNGSHSGSISLTEATAVLSITGGGYEFTDGAVVDGGSGTTTISGVLETSGTVSMSGMTTVAGVGPAVIVVGELIVSGTFEWTHGDLEGPGSITIPMGSMATFALSPPATLECRIDNHGEITWSSGQLRVGAPAGTSGITNHPGAVLDVTTGTDVIVVGSNETFIDNQGAITKTGPTVTTITDDLRFDNDNQVEVDAGVFVIATDEGETTGVFVVGMNGTLEIASTIGYSFAGNAEISGSGTVHVSGELSADADLPIEANLLELTGTIGGVGDVTLTGGMSWSDGLIAGPGAFVVTDGSTIDLFGGNLTLTTVLDNHGDAAFHSGTLWLNDGAFRNHADGGFRPSGVVQINGTAAGAFLNEGTIRQETPGTLTIAVNPSFDSPGTMTVTDGLVRVLAIHGTISGQVMIEPPGVLQLEANTGASTYVLGDGAQVTGDGTLVIAGRVFAEGTVVVDAAAQLIGAGILDGSGTIVFNGTLLWTTGEMSGTGTTIIGATGMATFGPGNRTLARPLDVLGTVDWTGGQILAPAAGSINILPGGVFGCEGGTSMPFFGAVITNGGLLSMDALMLTQINASFTNTATGTIEVRNGTLYLGGDFSNFAGGALIGGNYVVHDTFRFNFADVDVLDANLRIDGPGRVESHTGLDALDGLGTIGPGARLDAGPGATVPAGDPFTVPGTLGVGGLVTGGDADLPGILDVEIDGGEAPGVTAGLVDMTGTVTLGGGLVITLPGGDPPVGTSLDVVTAASVVGELDCIDLPALADGVMQVAVRSDRVTVSVVAGCVAPGDLDGDGVIGFNDLLLVLAGWGACPGPCCVADVNGDGAVDFADLLLVLAGWGPCPP